MPELRRSVLDRRHRDLGARMVPFGGWEMPLQYAGVLEEHRRCRHDAVVFDVSHLGSVRVAGPDAEGALQALFTNDLERIEPGRAQYTHLLDDADAHVVDDIIVWWLRPEEFLVVPNAANTAPALDAMAQAVRQGEVADVTASRAFLAVQGPTSRDRLATVLPAAAEVGRFAVGEVSFAGETVVVGGTGYTGEDGVELHVPEPVAGELWDRILDAGITPAGLGARDTLRLEMGYPLHGHELGPGISPLQAGLGWVVAWDKGPFRGRHALARQREAGVPQLLRGIRLEGRRVPREGSVVLHDGREVGRLTSGNFSPTLERGIGLALLVPGVEAGMSVEVDIRGKKEPAEVVAPPFVDR